MSTIAIYYLAFNEKRVEESMSVQQLEYAIENNAKPFSQSWEQIPSLFEVLRKDDFVKIYMDIENYNNEDFALLDDIITEFREYFKDKSGQTLGKYVLTENKHSRHPGRSFHVIFPEYKLKLSNLRNLIGGFVETHMHFNNVIDSTVYSDRRLFRLPRQHGICGLAKSEIQYAELKRRGEDTWKKWLETYGKENYHDFVYRDGITVDTNAAACSIIKNVNDCTEITTNFTCSKKFIPNGTSGGNHRGRGNVQVRLDLAPVVDSISKGFNTLAAAKEEIDVDSKIKVALLSLEFSGKEFVQNQRMLLDRLNEYFSKNQTYEGFEARAGSKLTKQEVYQLIKFVFNINE